MLPNVSINMPLLTELGALPDHHFLYKFWDGSFSSIINLTMLDYL